MPQLTQEMLQKFHDDIANAKPTKWDFVDESYIKIMLNEVVSAFEQEGLDTDIQYVRECIVNFCLALHVPEKEESIIKEKAEAFAEELAKCLY